MNKHRQMGIRIAISMGVGVLVAAIALAVAWRNIGGMSNIWPEQWATHRAIGTIEDIIQMHRATTKTLPKSLEDLRPVGVNWADLHWDESGKLLDGWKRPLVYSTDGTSCTIVSYGRDGQPGGIGIDSDLSSSLPSPETTKPTFVQFLFNPRARGIVATCLACGLGAFWVSMVTVTPSALHGWAIVALLVKLALTVLGALVASFFMSIFHIPNHH